MLRLYTTKYVVDALLGDLMLFALWCKIKFNIRLRCFWQSIRGALPLSEPLLLYMGCYDGFYDNQGRFGKMEHFQTPNPNLMR